MKKWRKPISLVAFAAAFVVVGGTFFLQNPLAATGQMYISPGSASVQNGKTVTVNVRINPGTTVNTVHVVLGYDTAKLQYTSLSTGGSPFGTQPVPPSVSGGTITFDQADLSGSVSSDTFIASVTFKALAGSGSASLSLSGSNAANAGVATGPGVAGATISFTTPPATCPAGYTGTPPNCTKPSTGGGSGGGTSSGGSSHSSGSGGSGGSTSGSGSSSNKTATPVTITDQKVQYTTASISATSKDPTKVYVRLGLNGQLTTNTAVSDFATSHTIVIDPSLLVPGQTYSYVVVSTNKQGVVTQSATQTFTTKGLTVSVSFVDKNHHPIKHKSVTLHSTPNTATTDGNGVAVFQNVAPGTHHAIYTAGKQSYDETVQVANNIQTVGDTQTAPTQNLSVVYGFVQSGSWWSSRWFIGTVVALVVVVAVVIFVRRNVASAGFGGGLPVTSEAIVVGGAPRKEATPPQNETTQHLSNIPYPSGPQPGNTVEPHNDNEGEEGRQ